VTNGEFEVFWRGPGKNLVEMPKSWVEDDHVIKVRLCAGIQSFSFPCIGFWL
jgi:hypothetical protein